VITRWRFS